MDSDPNPRIARDFTCGHRTYEGHTGTDIAIRDLETAGEGMFVIAAADGEVVETRGNVVDTFYDPNTVGTQICGNGVTIQHDKGWETRYCHLKEKSLVVKKGDRIKAGQILGQVGLSGGTTWPHLGFTVLRNGQFFDPFSGKIALEGCGLNPDSLWKVPENVTYQPFAIFNLGFSVGPPDENAIALGQPKLVALPSNTPSLSFWASTFGLNEGDRVLLHIYEPNGDELVFLEKRMEEPESKSFFFVSHDIGNGLWEPGVYRGVVTLQRGGDSEDITRWQRLIQIFE